MTDFVERLCPASRYAFSRYRHNERWDCHGDEAPAAPAAPADDDLDIPPFLQPGVAS